MTTPYKPAGLDRGDGQYKAPHQLIEYSQTVFDTSLDDADRDFRPLDENRSPPDQQRALMVAFDVARIIRSRDTKALATFDLVRKHVAALDLTLPRLFRLNRFARNNAVRDSWYKADIECAAQGATFAEWREASRLVHRAALAILLDVPAQNRADAIELASLVREALEPPVPAQRRQVAKRLARYFAEMLDGQYILDAPTRWVWGFGDDSMAPAFPAGTNALYERQKGELVSGGYYIFRTRRLGKPTQLVRRYLHTTPTGLLAVEMFKDATGKPHRAYFDPKYWRPYYRIVRHW
jgi:hypothetical protein